MPFTVVDLFCGCGGLTSGLKEAGFHVAAGVDAWDDALKVYAANHEAVDHEVVLHDLSDEDSTVEIVRKFSPFVVTGGPPCQDFSSAGKRTEGDRAYLTVKFARIVARSGARAFIMENVPRTQHADAFASALEIFREAGFGITMRVLDASLCGVPQLRKRMFVVGLAGAPDDFLADDLKIGMSEKPMTMREYFGDGLGLEHYYRHPRSYSRRGIYSIDEPSATIRGVNRPMPPAYSRHDADAHAPDETVRALTLDERARVQTFPRGYFDLKLPKASKEQMIGNAVPVGLAAHVGGSLMRYLRANGRAGDEIVLTEPSPMPEAA